MFSGLEGYFSAPFVLLGALRPLSVRPLCLICNIPCSVQDAEAITRFSFFTGAVPFLLPHGFMPQAMQLPQLLF